MSDPMTVKEKNIILDEPQILQKIKRMAYQIFEKNFKEKRVVMVGVVDQGYHLAELLTAELQSIAPFEVTLLSLQLDKSDPVNSEITVDLEQAAIKGVPVILVDDVLNTGRTMAYCLKPFLERDLKTLEIAVLVNRSHKQFPISANYQGYELATTINEHIEVVLEKKNKYAYLR